MTNNDNDSKHDPGYAKPPATTGPASSGALASLDSLTAALNAVDTSGAAGRSTVQMLSFKREHDGSWMYGQRRTLVEDDSTWAVNPRSFKRGYISFTDAKKIAGERLVSVTQPAPDRSELPDTGFAWSEQWAVALKCLDGADAGVDVAYKPTTVRGIAAIAGLIEAVRDRLNSGGQQDREILPVVQLRKDSYSHGQYGKVWTPLILVVDWMSEDSPGPTPAPAPASPPPPPPAAAAAAEQPRRRRVS